MSRNKYSSFFFFFCFIPYWGKIELECWVPWIPCTTYHRLTHLFIHLLTHPYSYPPTCLSVHLTFTEGLLCVGFCFLPAFNTFSFTPAPLLPSFLFLFEVAALFYSHFHPYHLHMQSLFTVLVASTSSYLPIVTRILGDEQNVCCKCVLSVWLGI